MLVIPATSSAVAPPLDTRWGRQGATTIDMGNVGGSELQVGWDSVGRTLVKYGQLPRIARLSARGAQDLRWGSDGLVKAPRGSSMVALANGSVVVVEGSFSTTRSGTFDVRRLTSAGTADRTFGSSGRVRLALPAPDSHELVVAQLACSTRIIGPTLTIDSIVQWKSAVGDNRRQLVTHTISTLSLQRPLPRFEVSVIDGVSPDASCGTSSDGVGGAYGFSGFPASFSRYSSGTVDLAFGPDANGSVSVDSGDEDTEIRSVTGHRDGVLVITRREVSGANAVTWLVQRFLSNGQLDTTYGDGGTVTLAPSLHVLTSLARVSVKPTGVTDIAIADRVTFAVHAFQLDATGRGIESFGNGGKMLIPNAIPRGGALVGGTVVREDSARRTHVATAMDGSTMRVHVRRYATDSADAFVRFAPARTVGAWKHLSMTMGNAGPRGVRSIVARIALPPGMAIRNVSSPSGTTCRTITTSAGTGLTCASVTVNAGERASVTFQVRPARGRAQRVQATATAKGRQDLRPRNNRAVLVLS